MKSQIVICIPINLSNRQGISAALTDRYGGEYVLLGRVFQSTVTGDSCTIEISDRKAYPQGNRTQRINKVERQILLESDSQSLGDDFELAAQDRLDVVTRQQIDRCPQVIYLTSEETGYNACLQIARLAKIMLTIGGVAIKVESTGITHTRQKWLANYGSDDVFEIYSLFVRLIEGEDYYYSCGMHNFGKADVAISLNEDIGLAIYVMNVFNYYRLTESPILLDGHIFQPDMGCPRYQMQWIEDVEETPNSYCYNPDGRWLLIG